jgi:Protein of unknown function (DUF1003)
VLIATTLPWRVVHRPPCDELITGRGIDEFGIRQRHLQRGQQLLTMIVSLEAIFLSTFVTISQNRADEKRQVIADQQWRTVQEEEQQNETLLRLSNEILALTKEIHTVSTAAMPVSPMGEDH